MHRSRLSAIIIDCQNHDPSTPAEFWAGALGREARRLDDRYVALPDERGLMIEVQGRTATGTHIDLETDDLQAEVRRLTMLGADLQEVRRDWVVMAAPSGQRFCVVAAEKPLTDKPGATEWPDIAPPSPDLVRSLAELVDDLQVPDLRLMDAEGIPSAHRVQAQLALHGHQAKVAVMFSWTDNVNVLQFGHAVTQVGVLIVDLTARLYDQTLPAVVILERYAYSRLFIDRGVPRITFTDWKAPASG